MTGRGAIDGTARTSEQFFPVRLSIVVANRFIKVWVGPKQIMTRSCVAHVSVMRVACG